MRLPLLPLLMAGAVLLPAGCHRAADAAAEAAIERASGQKMHVDRDGDRTRIRTDDGEIVVDAGDGMALPPDFPGDLFLPARYAVNSVMDISGARLVNLESEGSVASMFDSARETMEDKGWSQTLAMQQPDSAMLGFSQGTREATYTFTRRGDDQVMVGIQLRRQSDHQ